MFHLPNISSLIAKLRFFSFRQLIKQINCSFQLHDLLPWKSHFHVHNCPQPPQTFPPCPPFVHQTELSSAARTPLHPLARAQFPRGALSSFLSGLSKRATLGVVPSLLPFILLLSTTFHHVFVHDEIGSASLKKWWNGNFNFTNFAWSYVLEFKIQISGSSIMYLEHKIIVEIRIPICLQLHFGRRNAHVVDAIFSVLGNVKNPWSLLSMRRHEISLDGRDEGGF